MSTYSQEQSQVPAHYLSMVLGNRRMRHSRPGVGHMQRQSARVSTLYGSSGMALKVPGLAGSPREVKKGREDVSYT
jgi:hypothetical protein